LVRPSDEEVNLQNLINIPDEDLRSDFVDGIKMIKEIVNNKIECKAIYNHKLNGQQFVYIANS